MGIGMIICLAQVKEGLFLQRSSSIIQFTLLPLLIVRNLINTKLIKLLPTNFWQRFNKNKFMCPLWYSVYTMNAQ